MEVQKFRKKPVIIEALQFKYTVEGIEALSQFCGDKLLKYGTERHIGAKPWAWFGTVKDGIHHGCGNTATEGDWIIKDERGEFYACHPDNFEKIYERVE
jgi:hypothetical protein